MFTIDLTGIMRAFGIDVAISSTRGSDNRTVWALCAQDTNAVRHFVDRGNF